MIQLAESKIKTTSITLGDQTTTVILDTIVLQSLYINKDGNITVDLRFGTMADGKFVETDTAILATVYPDGTFNSNDPKYKGQLDNATMQPMLKALFNQFESFLIASGWASGTVS